MPQLTSLCKLSRELRTASQFEELPEALRSCAALAAVPCLTKQSVLALTPQPEAAAHPVHPVPNARRCLTLQMGEHSQVSCPRLRMPHRALVAVFFCFFVFFFVFVFFFC